LSSFDVVAPFDFESWMRRVVDEGQIRPDESGVITGYNVKDMVDVQTVVVGMSGGVDSSVTAALLKKQGYNVIGVMLRLWSEPGKESFNRCCAPDAMALARRVAAQLDIPFYVVDARQVFHDRVVAGFLQGYSEGITPNPCLACNRTVRWGHMLEEALALNADFMATGHYARLRRNDQGRMELYRSVDDAKDQSYVLSVLNQDQLNHTLLPLGSYTKPEVRRMAQELGLAAAERPDSQDLCFLAGDDYRGFLQRNAPEALQPGPVIDRLGKVLGQHEGLARYTIGQRKGLGVPSEVPLYVLEKRQADRTLVVGPVEELGASALVAVKAHWISGQPPEDGQVLSAKIRYKAKEAQATFECGKDDGFALHFEYPLRDITPGQVVVLYQGELCLGCGIIQRSL
jgi:tRNA-uridine 2-sulfurtransferase